MQKNPALLRNRVLILTDQSGERTEIQKKLAADGGFEAFFNSDIDKVTELLHQHQCGVFVHNWDAASKEKNCLLQQRIAKMDDFANLCRIIYAKMITPEVGALAADSGVDRVITLTNLKLNIPDEIRMARSAVSNISELQQKIRSISRGLEIYTQSDVDKTIGEAFERFPHDPFVRLEYGNLCLRRLKLELAKNISVDLLGKNPKNVRASTLLSRVLMKQKKFDESLQVLENANILSPKNLERLLLLGEVCIEKGERKKARSYYKEAHDAYPGNADAATAIATLDIEDGDFNAAIELFRNSMSEEIAAGILNNAGIQAVRQNNPDLAIKFYQLALESLKTKKYFPQIYFNLALAKRRTKDYEEAIKFLNKALKCNPDYRKARKQIREIESLIKPGKKAG